MMPDDLLRRLEGRRSAVIAQALGELAEYFSGTRRDFSLPLHLEGTPFQQRIWELLLQIPYGETRTYAQLATQAGNPGASRAVGAASNRNPMLLLVPCHRVVGSNGTLVGYAGGVDIKEKLLRLECIHATLEP
jgi:methylated-DNA-[protein]-cysteine S-methyltransferase